MNIIYHLVQVTDTYSNAELFWVQEEHKNMGAWSYVQPRTQTAVGGYHRYWNEYLHLIVFYPDFIPFLLQASSIRW